MLVLELAQLIRFETEVAYSDLGDGLHCRAIKNKNANQSMQKVQNLRSERI